MGAPSKFVEVMHCMQWDAFLSMSYSIGNNQTRFLG